MCIRDRTSEDRNVSVAGKVSRTTDTVHHFCSADIQRQYLFITKRRSSSLIAPAYCLLEAEELASVSYTHLDVYKRQI